MASTIDSKPQQTVLQRNCGDSALTAVMRCCFCWLGVTVTWDMFQSHWLAMLIGIAAAIGARVIVIYGLLPIGSRVLPGGALPNSYQPALMWCGLRGAASLAQALSFRTKLTCWYSVQSIVYGVILFTLFVQAPLMPRLLRNTL